MSALRTARDADAIASSAMNDVVHGVLIVDDHAVVAEALAAAFTRSDAFADVHWATTAQDALRLATEHSLELVITDLRMPKVDGAELVRQLAELQPRPRLLVLSVAADARSILGAFEAGADGFLGKHESFEAVLAASRSVMLGDNPISASAFARVLPRLLRQGSDLTEQEERVLEQLAANRSNDDIAGQLDISYNTVRNHVSSILRKLDVESRGEAVVEARRRLLIPPVEPGI